MRRAATAVRTAEPQRCHPQSAPDRIDRSSAPGTVRRRDNHPIRELYAASALAPPLLRRVNDKTAANTGGSQTGLGRQQPLVYDGFLTYTDATCVVATDGRWNVCCSGQRTYATDPTATFGGCNCVPQSRRSPFVGRAVSVCAGLLERQSNQIDKDRMSNPPRECIDELTGASSRRALAQVESRRADIRSGRQRDTGAMRCHKKDLA